MSSAKVMSANMTSLALQRFNPKDVGFSGSWRELPLSAQDVSQARVFDGPGSYIKHDLLFPRPPLQAVEDNLNKWHKNMVQDLHRNCGREKVLSDGLSRYELSRTEVDSIRFEVRTHSDLRPVYIHNII